MPSGLVNNKGKRVMTGNSTGFITYDYRSPGVNFPNEGKKGEELAELSSGVTTVQYTNAEVEEYLANRKIGNLSRIGRKK